MGSKSGDIVSISCGISTSDVFSYSIEKFCAEKQNVVTMKHDESSQNVLSPR